METNKIINMAIALIMIAVLLPVGLNLLMTAEWSEELDPAVLSIITVVLPIMAILGVVLGFMKSNDN